jgi:hypothetical protein
MISSDAPDWSYWRLIPTVTLLEAVSLSLNIDPRTLVPHPPKGRLHGLATVRIPPSEFYSRLDLAMRCIGEMLPGAKPRSGEGHVTLQSFTKWAAGLGWDVPPELEALAGDIELSDSMAKSELEQPTHSGVPGKPAKGKQLIDQQYVDQKQPRARPQQRAFMAWREGKYPNGTIGISVKELAAEYNRDTGKTVDPSTIRRALGRKR